MPRKIEISHRTIVFTVVFLLSVWFVYFIRDILLQLFVALVIMVILNPLVSRLNKYKIPRALSIGIIYILLFSFIGFVIASVAQPLIEETTNFAVSLPRYLEEIKIPVLIREEIGRQLTSQLGSIPSQIIRLALSIFSNAINIIAVFTFAFYLLLSRNKLTSQLATFFSTETSKRIDKIIDLLEKRLGGWARGQLLLMVSVAALTYVGLTLLKIPFVLPLALLAGILEVVPLIGPILAAVPAAIVGFGIGPVSGLAVTSLAFLIQQVESYFLVPKVMERSAGISPIVTLLALAIGFKVAGIVGAILSVPIIITLQILAKEFVIER